MDVRKVLTVDAVVLAAYLVAANPSFTGIPAHEWIGVGLFVLFVVHAAQHYDWVVETLCPSRARRPRHRAANLALDVLILLAFMVCTVSGLLTSGTVLASFGLYADGYYFWDPLHAASAKVLLALLIVHVVVHARMVAKTLKG